MTDTWVGTGSYSAVRANLPSKLHKLGILVKVILVWKILSHASSGSAFQLFLDFHYLRNRGQKFWLSTGCCHPRKDMGKSLITCGSSRMMCTKQTLDANMMLCKFMKLQLCAFCQAYIFLKLTEASLKLQQHKARHLLLLLWRKMYFQAFLYSSWESQMSFKAQTLQYELWPRPKGWYVRQTATLALTLSWFKAARVTANKVDKSIKSFLEGSLRRKSSITSLPTKSQKILQNNASVQLMVKSGVWDWRTRWLPQ